MIVWKIWVHNENRKQITNENKINNVPTTKMDKYKKLLFKEIKVQSTKINGT